MCSDLEVEISSLLGLPLISSFPLFVLIEYLFQHLHTKKQFCLMYKVILVHRVISWYGI